VCKPLQIDVWRHEGDAPGRELARANGLPCIEANDELGCAQKNVRAAGLAKLDATEHCLGSVPAPTQSELVEAHVEARLGAYEAFEGSPVFGYARERKLVSDDERACDSDDGRGRNYAGADAPMTEQRGHL
jgi:hypothetical protein